MTQVAVFALAFILDLIAAGVSRYFGLSCIVPDVGLIAAVYLALVSPPISGIITVSILGLVTDLMTYGGLLGLAPTLYVLAFMLVRSARSRVIVWTIPGQLLLGFVSSIGASAAKAFFVFLFDRFKSSHPSVSVAFVVILVTTFSTPIFFVLFDLFRVLFKGRVKDGFGP